MSPVSWRLARARRTGGPSVGRAYYALLHEVLGTLRTLGLLAPSS